MSVYKSVERSLKLNSAFGGTQEPEKSVCHKRFFKPRHPLILIKSTNSICKQSFI